MSEITRQLRDQPLHFIWGAATSFSPFAAHHWLGPAAFAAVTIGSLISASVIVVREYQQWPSQRWWDPYLDWAFFAGGALAGLGAGVWIVFCA